VYLTGELGKGLNSSIIDLILIGDVNREYLLKLIDRVEQLINKKVRYVIYSEREFKKLGESVLGPHHFLLWSNNT
jgi:hypothetical protein